MPTTLAEIRDVPQGDVIAYLLKNLSAFGSYVKKLSIEESVWDWFECWAL